MRQDMAGLWQVAGVLFAGLAIQSKRDWKENGRARLQPGSIRYYFMRYWRMAMATSYSIGKHFEELVESLIASGRYSTASEVMREGLRLIEEREQRRIAKLEALRAEIQKGFDSGPAEEVGDMFARIKADGRKRLAARDGK